MQSGGVYTRHRMEAQTGTANIEDSAAELGEASFLAGG